MEMLLYPRMSASIIALALTAGIVAGTDGASAKGCAAPPLPVTSLKLTRFYADGAGTIIDRDLKKQHRQQVRPLVSFLRHVVKDADRSLPSGTATASKKRKAAASGHCALRWITAWARGGAMLGVMASKQAAYERNWDMTGLALAYLKLRRLASGQQRQIIEPWLIKLAECARGFFDNPGRRRNNHWYWLGLGLGATALATDSQRHWAMARAIMGDAAKDIGADGTLAYEMARKGRALHYHAFAAMALVTLAELAASRGQDWYGLQAGALHRLVALTVRGLQQPQLFRKLSGYRQSRPIKAGAGWLLLYAARFPDRLAAPLPAMKYGHRWLGGDLRKLQKILRARGPGN